MNLSERINAFIALGEQLKNFQKPDIEELAYRTLSENPWFTLDNVTFAVKGLANYLEEGKLREWVSKYPECASAKKIAVVMAGNIPMVGVHDLICVLICGHSLQVKLSSQDSFLMKFLMVKLIQIAPEFAPKIEIVEIIKDFDAVIATGSDNTARYFDYYFGKYPNIIRKNRTSVAVLDGSESSEQLARFGTDIFTYFGLGCRNVTKLYVPENYSFIHFFESIESYNHIGNHYKYANNYDYNKSIYLVNKVPHFDNGFLMLTEKESLFSPISVLHYEKYANLESLETLLKLQEEKIQCIVASKENFPQYIDFGKAQFPDIQDYADGIDTMNFLTSL